MTPSNLSEHAAVVEAAKQISHAMFSSSNQWSDENTRRIIAAAVAKVCGEAIEAEQTRWQERIDAILRQAVPDVDGSGCDSGDPLDLTATEIELVINELENAERL